MFKHDKVKILYFVSLCIICLLYSIQSMNSIKGAGMTITITRTITEYETITTTRTTQKMSTSTSTIVETITKTRTSTMKMTSTHTETLDLRSTTTLYTPCTETYETTVFESQSSSTMEVPTSPASIIETQKGPQSVSTPSSNTYLLGIIALIVVGICSALAFKFKRKKSEKQISSPDGSMQKFCINCGNPITSEVAFCQNCGERQD